MGAYDCDCINNLEYDRRERKAQLSKKDTTKDAISRQAAIDAVEKNACNTQRIIDAVNNLPPAQPEPQHERIFQEIVVEYPSYSTYPEYKGKPYFSIKYTENGQKFIGYGTYKPEVLSQYLKEYFMPPAQPEPQEGYWIRTDCGLDVECKCSECGYKDFVSPHDTYWFKRNYCPNCGAKMTIAVQRF